MKNVIRVSVEQLQLEIISRMKSLVTNDKGEVAPGFEGIFDNFLADDMGNPVLQTIAGMVVIENGEDNEPRILYSPNMGIEAESIASETVDLADVVNRAGYDLVVCTGHYVDPQGTVSYGEEARKVKRHVEMSVMLNQIREMQNESDKTPKLILPNSQIITR